eukprot:scaffold4138_cov132-Amphora_coffeaeformis.AAC.2
MDKRALEGLSQMRLQTRGRSLYSVLTSHIVETVIAAKLRPSGASTLQPLVDSTKKLVRRGSSITINSSKIQTTDILVTNGIAHTVSDLFTALNSVPPTPSPGPRPAWPKPAPTMKKPVPSPTHP